MIGVCCSMHSRLNLFLLCYLCVCLHSGRWCLLPGFASISSELNDLGISFDMCRWNLQSSCDPWHWSFCSTCAAHLGSSPGLCSWCWDVLRTSCKLKLSNTVSDIKVGILQIYCKWYYANAHVSNSVFALPGCCCCFLGMPPSTSFFWMIWRITKFFRPNGVWLGFHHDGILNFQLWTAPCFSCESHFCLGTTKPS